jgi:Leucine-rich repeat (LRR) protein
MEKYKVDYSEFSHFKGITIEFDYLEEGFNYAQKHNIKDVLVRSKENNIKQIVDFDFLKGFDFIENFGWIVSLSKKSDITGLYHLSKLKKLRWGGARDFVFDLSFFSLLEELNIGYNHKISGWNSLTTLKFLLLNGVKTDSLDFLKDTTSLEYLRIIRGSFTSIAGIENCSKLKTLFLQKCTSLTKLKPTIDKLSSLEQLNLEGCRKVDVKEQLKGLGIKNMSVI